MKRRTMMVMFGVLGVGLLAGAAGLAFAHQGREGMMKRFVSSAIDDALATAQPTPEQRAAIHAARDRDVDVVLGEILGHQRAQACVVLDEERGRPGRGGRLHGMWRP